MLRKILELLLQPEPIDILENKEIIDQLTTEQHTALQLAIKKKDLVSYLELAYAFEHNGDPLEHAKKLDSLFNDVTKSLEYLLDFSKKYPHNTQFVHDACLFPLLTDAPTWKKLTLQNGARLLLDAELKQILYQTKEVEQQLLQDKKIADELLKTLFIKYEKTTIEPIAALIKNRIAEINKFCHKYETKAEYREEEDEELYCKLLFERNELYKDRACLHLHQPLKQ